VPLEQIKLREQVDREPENEKPAQAIKERHDELAQQVSVQ